jgi:hypothetical protein
MALARRVAGAAVALLFTVAGLCHAIDPAGPRHAAVLHDTGV